MVAVEGEAVVCEASGSAYAISQPSSATTILDAPQDFSDCLPRCPDSRRGTVVFHHRGFAHEQGHSQAAAGGGGGG